MSGHQEPERWSGPVNREPDYATLEAQGLSYVRELMDLTEQSPNARRAVHLVLRLVELANKTNGAGTI